MVDHHTLDIVFLKMAWSFNALWLGKHPTHDWENRPIHDRKAGTDLADGYFACVWCLPGDLDYWKGDLELPNSRSGSPCGCCPCNSSDCPWWDFRPNALWLTRIYDIQAFEDSGWNRCKLFTIVGVTVHSLHPDWMHAKHLGTDKVKLGSVLWLLVHFVVEAPDVDERLSIVWGMIQKLYKEDHVANRFGNLKMTMFTAGASSKLKGKAAEVRDLGPVLHKVWMAFYNPNLEVHRKIELVLRTGARLDAVLDEHPGAYALPRDAAADLVSTAFVTCHSLLS